MPKSLGTFAAQSRTVATPDQITSDRRDDMPDGPKSGPPTRNIGTGNRRDLRARLLSVFLKFFLGILARPSCIEVDGIRGDPEDPLEVHHDHHQPEVQAWPDLS